ncbi:DUF882 domain-containing protein [Azospirillum sp. sgz302134]
MNKRPFLRLSWLSLLAGGILAGCASTPTPQTSLGGDPRSITLYHPASGETVSVTYWRPGGYDPAALQRISELFRDRRTGDVAPVDPALVDMLVELRERCGATPDTPVQITSGYRSQATNVALARTNPNVAEHSYHLRGQAADIYIPGVSARRIAEEAEAMHRGGYAMYASTGHVHVDTGPFRTWTPKGNGEPRTTPAILEARATPRKPAAPTPEPARAEVAAVVESEPKPKPVEVKAAPVAAPAPAPRKAAPAPAQVAAKAEPDLSRVRYVLAQLKDQPAPVAAKRKP